MADGTDIIVNQMHLVVENYLVNDATIQSIQPGFNTVSSIQNHSVDFTISVGSDNSIVLQRKKEAAEKVGKAQKCTLYPPPSAQEIGVVRYSMLLDRLILMLTNCSLCVYQVNRETALLEHIFPQRDIRDSEDKPIVIQQITSMELITTKSKDDIPPFDREMLNQQVHMKSVADVITSDDTQEFLAIGMSKGTIFLVHVNSLKMMGKDHQIQMYCRFTVHREAVTLVRYLPHTKTFASQSSQNDFYIWQIDKVTKNIKVLQHFFIGRGIRMFSALDTTFEWPNCPATA